MKLIKKLNKKNIIIISCLLAFVFAIVILQNSEKKVQKQLTEDIEKLKSLDEQRVLEIVKTTNPPDNITSYKELVEEILKNSTYTIESVTKLEDQVIAVLITETPNNDLLIKDFFDVYVNENINAVLNKKTLNKNTMFDLGFKNILEKMKSSELSKTTSKINVIFEKDKSNKWAITNSGEYYDALVGQLFTKINIYKNEQLQEVFLKSFFESLNTITPLQVSNLFDGDNQKNDIYIILSKLYNNTTFTILDKTQNQDETIFKVKVDMINVKEFYNYSVEQYIKFFKEQNDKKQTPTEEQQKIKLQEIFVQSIEINKDKKISKEMDLILDNNLNIKNITDFFGLILNDYITESQIASKSIAEKIKMLYTKN